MTAHGTTSTRSRQRAVVRHHADLLRVASMLTDDSDRAERLVVQAVISSERLGADLSLRALSAQVVVAWMCRLPAETVPPRSGSTLLGDVHDLTDDQQVSLALCVHGSHTYRQAAGVLGLPPGQVAELLCTALRALQRSSPAPGEPPLTV